MTINLLDFFTYFKGTPNQKAAVQMLAEVMPSSLMVDDASWVEKFREPEPLPESVVPAQCLDIIAEFEVQIVPLPVPCWDPHHRLRQHFLFRWTEGVDVRPCN